MADSGCVKPYNTSQVRSEIKYLLQGGICEGKLIGNTLRVSEYISMEISVLSK